MGKKDEQYKAWVAEVESNLDEAQKANFRAIVDSPAGEKVFAGHLREADYYRRLNEQNAEQRKLEQERAQLYQWYEAEAPKNQKLIQERENLARELENTRKKALEFGLEDDDLGTPKAVRDAVQREELEKVKEEWAKKYQLFDKALPHLLGNLSDIAYKSMKENMDVSPSQVIKYSMDNNVDPVRAYDALTYEERERRATKAREEELTKAREQGRREALSKFPSPDNIRPNGPSIIDTLRAGATAPSTSRDRVSAAVAEFMEMGTTE